MGFLMRDKELVELETRLKQLEDEKAFNEKKDKTIAKIRELEKEKSPVNRLFKFIKDH